MESSLRKETSIMKKLVLAFAVLFTLVMLQTTSYAYTDRIQKSLDAMNDTYESNRTQTSTVHYNNITGNYDVNTY